MKRVLVILLIFISASALKAQNVQLHYNLGDNQKYLWSHVEMFKPDKWGSTFFFIDMNYGEANMKGVTMAYWEIARAVKFWDSPFALHAEFNGGFGQFKNTSLPNGAYSINNAWLFGGEYTWNTKDFSKIFTLQMLYKTIQDKNSAAFQITGVWTIQMLKNKVTFCGFADFWREDNFATSSNMTQFVFLTKPQLWYNFNKNLSAGTEFDISANFSGHRGAMVNPNLSAKWTF
ncbi:MAG: DUF5020 family protein [Prolixibacteraceae bacterium]